MPPASVSSQYTRTGKVNGLMPACAPAEAAGACRSSLLALAEQRQAARSALGVRRPETEMQVRDARRHPSTCRAHHEALLNQERLDHILDGVAFLANRGRQAVDADGTAGEFLDDREQ